MFCYYLLELPSPGSTLHPDPVFALNRRVNALDEAPSVIESFIHTSISRFLIRLELSMLYQGLAFIPRSIALSITSS